MVAEEVLPYFSIFEKNLLHRKIDHLGRRFENPGVGLVGNHQIDILAGQAVEFQGLHRDVGQGPHGHFEQLIPRHFDIVHPAVRPSRADEGLADPPPGI